MKIAIPIIIVVAIIGFLVNSAVLESSKKVVTVQSLLSEDATNKGAAKYRVRVGARVSSPDIQVQGGDNKQVSFYVSDPENKPSENPQQMKVIFKGLMPDTLKESRDVIMEGDYKDGIFFASNLNTQCPSKYKPPTPE